MYMIECSMTLKCMHCGQWPLLGVCMHVEYRTLSPLTNGYRCVIVAWYICGCLNICEEIRGERARAERTRLRERRSEREREWNRNSLSLHLLYINTLELIIIDISTRHIVPLTWNIINKILKPSWVTPAIPTINIIYTKKRSRNKWRSLPF